MIIEEDVHEFLEHHGVKGQKWGVRKDRHTQKVERQQARIDRLKRIATGTKRPGDFYKSGGATKGYAEATLDRALRDQQAFARGERKVRNFLYKLQGVDYAELNFRFKHPAAPVHAH